MLDSDFRVPSEGQIRISGFRQNARFGFEGSVRMPDSEFKVSVRTAGGKWREAGRLEG